MRICLLMWCTIHYVCNTLSHQTAGNMTTNAFKTISECNARGFTVDLQFMQNKIVRITITKQTKNSVLLTSWTVRGLADLIDKAVGLWVADHSGALQGGHLTPVNKHIDPDLEKALS